MQQTVEVVALFHVDVAQAAAGQVGAFAEVVADTDRGDLLDQADGVVVPMDYRPARDGRRPEGRR